MLFYIQVVLAPLFVAAIAFAIYIAFNIREDIYGGGLNSDFIN